MCRVCKGITGSKGWIAACRYFKSKRGFTIYSNCLYFVILISSHFSNTSIFINICEYDIYFLLLLPSMFLICECIL